MIIGSREKDKERRLGGSVLRYDYDDVLLRTRTVRTFTASFGALESRHVPNVVL